jgi:hypothetical protein
VALANAGHRQVTDGIRRGYMITAVPADGHGPFQVIGSLLVVALPQMQVTQVSASVVLPTPAVPPIAEITAVPGAPRPACSSKRSSSASSVSRPMNCRARAGNCCGTPRSAATLPPARSPWGSGRANCRRGMAARNSDRAISRRPSASAGPEPRAELAAVDIHVRSPVLRSGGLGITCWPLDRVLMPSMPTG